MRARLFFLMVAAAAGCNDPVYLDQHHPLETRVAAMGGYADDFDLFVVPVRLPYGFEARAMQQETMRLGLMMPVPWARLSDFDIEINWTMKNLDNQAVDASFFMDGGNEFGDYAPQRYYNPLVPAANQVLPPDLVAISPTHLQANEIRSGVIREDDIHEMAIDLEAITRYPSPGDIAGTPFIVRNHDSTVTNLGLEGVPKTDVTPAMVRFAFHLAAGGHVALDYSVRIRDHVGKLAPITAPRLYVSTAALLVGPAPTK
jgi:hypothetical protein